MGKMRLALSRAIRPSDVHKKSYKEHCENLSRLNSVLKGDKSIRPMYSEPDKPVNKLRKLREQELLLHLRNKRELSKKQVLQLLHLLDTKEMDGQS